MKDYAKLVEDLQVWHTDLQGGERDGRILRADECYALSLALECAWQTILGLQSQNEILEATNNALDPEGSRRRLEMQQGDGLSPFEEAPRSKREWGTTPKRPAGKSQFWNL